MEMDIDLGNSHVVEKWKHQCKEHKNSFVIIALLFVSGNLIDFVVRVCVFLVLFVFSCYELFRNK